MRSQNNVVIMTKKQMYFLKFNLALCNTAKFCKRCSPQCGHQRCSMKKCVLRNFAKFTGKHCARRLFFNKVAGLRPQACNFIEKEALAQVFACEFYEISKSNLFTEHLWATASTLGKNYWKLLVINNIT